ncbi:hypothetical protein [Streptomyces wuyuanensis]|uniref:hypothetical protein n=1 Tax=Streptomyces wuyuanensis TaxID=1196353 RepID=UPI00341F66BE
MAVSTARTDAKSRISARASAVAAQAKEKALRATALAREKSVAGRAAPRHGEAAVARNLNTRPGRRARTLATAARQRPGTALAAGGVVAAGVVVALLGARRRRDRR